MHADVATAATEFRTVRDMIRYAVSRFNAAGIVLRPWHDIILG